MTKSRLILLVGALAGLLGVILAALGSHMVPGLDELAKYKSWQAANSMHLLHSVALLFLALLHRNSGDRMIFVASLVILLGVVLFSGSIYLSLMASMAGATRVAPAGGLLLMLGWLLIAVHAFRNSNL